MANYAIMRIEKRKLGAVGRICKHNERLKTEYKSNPDIDPARSHLNYHLMTPKDSYRKEVLDRITHAGARMRKDSVVMQDSTVGEGARLNYAVLDKEVIINDGRLLSGYLTHPFLCHKGDRI